MRNIFFFEPDKIPVGVVASTARKGVSWFNDVQRGETVRMMEVGTKELVGYAVVVEKELVTYEDALDNAGHSQLGFNQPAGRARAQLWETLHRAYGNINSTDPFTILHLLPLHKVIDIVDLDNVAERTAANEEAADALAAAMESIDQLLVAGERATQIAKDNYAVAVHLTEENVALKAPGEQNANYIMDVGMAAAAAWLAAKDEGAPISAVEQVSVVGDIEQVVRIEF